MESAPFDFASFPHREGFCHWAASRHETEPRFILAACADLSPPFSPEDIMRLQGVVLDAAAELCSALLERLEVAFTLRFDSGGPQAHFPQIYYIHATCLAENVPLADIERVVSDYVHHLNNTESHVRLRGEYVSDEDSHEDYMEHTATSKKKLNTSLN